MNAVLLYTKPCLFELIVFSIKKKKRKAFRENLENTPPPKKNLKEMCIVMSTM